MIGGILAVLVVTMLVAGGPAPADAGGVKIIINGGPSFHHRHHAHPHRIHPGGRVIVLPQPVYIVQPRRCLAPGYWTYTWVPQSQVYNAWVLGHYSSDALWIEGHYEPRVHTWGSYQPYWIPERWTYC